MSTHDLLNNESTMLIFPSKHMKISLHALFATTFCLFFSAFPLFSESDIERTARFLPDMDRPLAVRLALPENYVVAPAPGDDSLNLLSGVIWGTQDVINEMKLQTEKKNCLTQGIFRVKLTPNITQTDIDRFSFGDDASLKKELESSGAQNIAISRYTWGEYPVVSARFLTGGAPQRVAWIGLNNNGLVLFVSYQFPPAKTDLKQDEEIWNTFLTQTTIFNPKDYLKAHGYEITLGSSMITKNAAQVRFTSQKTKKGKAYVLIETLTSQTDCTVISSTRRTAKQAHQSRFDIVINLESAVKGKYTNEQELIPLFPTPVEKVTLQGTTVYEDEDLVAIVRKK
jgi:hypothetical protein